MTVKFDIVVRGVPHESVRNGLTDIVGDGNVELSGETLRLTVADQSAMVGVLNRLHDLGLEIERVERSATSLVH